MKKINKSGQEIGQTLGFSFSEVREWDWQNVVTIHQHSL